jgi:hypothetical protein
MAWMALSPVGVIKARVAAAAAAEELLRLPLTVIKEKVAAAVDRAVMEWLQYATQASLITAL